MEFFFQKASLQQKGKDRLLHFIHWDRIPIMQMVCAFQKHFELRESPQVRSRLKLLALKNPAFQKHLLRFALLDAQIPHRVDQVKFLEMQKQLAAKDLEMKKLKKQNDALEQKLKNIENDVLNCFRSK